MAAMARLVAQDLMALTPGVRPERDWDGNEAQEWAAIRYDRETERSGGYRWYSGTPGRVIAGICADRECGWANVEALAKALSA